MLVAASSEGSGGSLVVLGALIVVAFLVRRGRLQSRRANLAKGERMRPLLITWIDPVISLVIIGPLLWRLLAGGGANVFAAISGGVVGAVIGYLRARVMFVRAEKGSFAVVLKRSGVEYALVGVLIVLRSLEGQLELHRVSASTAVVSALAALGLVEAFVRVGCIIGRYGAHRELPTPAAGTASPATGTPDAVDPEVA